MTITMVEDGIKQQTDEILASIDTDLLIPKVFLTKSKNMNGLKILHFYVNRPYPLFLLDPIYETFYNAFLSKGINPNALIQTTGSKNNMNGVKERLSKSSNKISKTFLKTKIKNPKIEMKFVILQIMD